MRKRTKTIKRKHHPTSSQDHVAYIFYLCFARINLYSHLIASFCGFTHSLEICADKLPQYIVNRVHSSITLISHNIAILKPGLLRLVRNLHFMTCDAESYGAVSSVTPISFLFSFGLCIFNYFHSSACSH